MQASSAVTPIQKMLLINARKWREKIQVPNHLKHKAGAHSDIKTDFRQRTKLHHKRIFQGG